MANSSSSSTCKYGFKLARYISTYNVDGRAQAWRMRIEVTDYQGIDPNIFVYERKSGINPGDPTYDVFVGVASPVDFEEYGVGTPNNDSPYFRLAEVDLLSRNKELLEETWYYIKADCEELIRSLSYLCDLDLEAEYIFGEI